jgi:hypothetical protein
MHESIGVWLPERMRNAGTSEYCQAVEVPVGFSGKIPDGFGHHGFACLQVYGFPWRAVSGRGLL